jgi:hypothetical protein
MRMGIGQLPTRIQLIERQTIRRQGTTPVSGYSINHRSQREIEPRDSAIGQHQRPVVGFGEGAAAGGHNRMPLGE